MTALRTKRIRLVTFATLICGFIVLMLFVASTITQVSNYQFNKDLSKRSEFIISSSALNGGLPLAVAAGDFNGIKSIVNNHLHFEEVYAIEVRNEANTLLYRQEKEVSEAVRIERRSYQIIAPFDEFQIDSMDSFSGGSETKEKLGELILYFSMGVVEDPILKHFYYACGVLFIAVLILGVILFSINKYLLKHLSAIKSLMESIENSENINRDDIPVSKVAELGLITQSLVKLADTVYQRDRELKDSLRNAIELREDAIKAEKFKDDFINELTHDIRTPVNVVYHLLEHIADDELSYKPNAVFKQRIKACLHSSRALNSVVTELFNFEKFKGEDLKNNIEEISVEELFFQVESLYTDKFLGKKLKFSVSEKDPVAVDKQRIIALDYEKLIRCLDNLLSNAYKFTKEGVVAVVWSLSENQLKVSIKDSGIGIQEEKLGSIFNKYTQLKDEESQNSEGRGLGLFYVKTLLDVLEADIAVSSKPGIGTVFDISAPYKAAIETLETSEIQTFKGVSAFVVDDDEATCYTLKDILAKYEVQCESECIPELGLQRIINENPDVVFIDYQMPQLSGDKLAKSLRKSSSGNATFLVCITAVGSETTLERLNDHFHMILQKPFEIAAITSILDKVYNSKVETQTILKNIGYKEES